MKVEEANPEESPRGRVAGRTGARLELPGSGSSPAELEVSYQPRRTRLVRALTTLIASWLLLPIVFFIPPHVPWVIVVFAGGAILAWRFWRGEYVVTGFAGSCPRCGRELEVKPGSRIRAHQTLECYGCHRQPELVLDAPAV